MPLLTAASLLAVVAHGGETKIGQIDEALPVLLRRLREWLSPHNYEVEMTNRIKNYENIQLECPRL